MTLTRRQCPVTFAGLEEAEMLFIPDLGSDAVVVEVVRVAYRPSKAKLVPPESSSLVPTVTCGVRKAGVQQV